MQSSKIMLNQNLTVRWNIGVIIFLEINKRIEFKLSIT